jgi:tRNA dimethylallyltransferase
MDIGTAKPTAAERRGVPHHLIDIASVVDEFSVAAFVELAYGAIEDVAARGQLPIVAGGTPQYLRALLEGWQAPAVPPDPAFRAALEREPAEAVYAQLQHADPDSAARIDPRNKRRLIRALEIVRATGAPVSAAQGQAPPPYRFHVVGLRQPRELLVARVDARVRAMFAAGWLAEVAALRAQGATATTPAMTAHGYREALATLEGTLALDDAIRRTQRMVHRYIRHQETWFRRFSHIHWFDSSQPGWDAAAEQSVAEWLGDLSF